MDEGDREITELVARAQAGDSESLGKLFERLSDRIYRFFALRTADAATAEDLTQTVFLEMIQALPRYKVQPNAKFSTWLFQIARFRLIDHYRKQRPNVPLDEVPEPSHEPLLDRDPVARDRLEHALRRLSEKYQTVLHFRFREGLSAKEVAPIMKTTALNVRVMQFRALRALRSALARFDDHEHQ